MRLNNDGEWELDPEHFKVICQKCGKVGEIDIHKFYPSFILRVGQMPTSDVEIWEYHLCRSCYDQDKYEKGYESEDDSREVER